jgi:hypothetical protein
VGGELNIPRLEIGRDVSIVRLLLFGPSICTIAGEFSCTSRSDRPRQRSITCMFVSPSSLFLGRWETGGSLDGSGSSEVRLEDAPATVFAITDLGRTEGIGFVSLLVLTREDAGRRVAISAY